MSTLKFNSTKSKNVVFVISMSEEEVPPEFVFRIKSDEIEYGFIGEYQDGKVRFKIPPLVEVSKGKLKTGRYSARVDAVGEAYYLKPWTGDIEILAAPDMKVKGVGESYEAKSMPKIEAAPEMNEDDEDDDIEPQPIKSPKPDPKFTLKENINPNQDQIEAAKRILEKERKEKVLPKVPKIEERQDFKINSSSSFSRSSEKSKISSAGQLLKQVREQDHLL